jgi:hypothetical protein
MGIEWRQFRWDKGSSVAVGTPARKYSEYSKRSAARCGVYRGQLEPNPPVSDTQTVLVAGALEALHVTVTGLRVAKDRGYDARGQDWIESTEVTLGSLEPGDLPGHKPS